MTPRRHHAAGDLADARHREHLAHLGLARDDLFELRLEQTDECVVDVVEHVVDDLVEAHLDAFALGHLAGLAVGTNVEADDRRVRDGREVEIGLGDTADPAEHERQPYFVVLLVELAQRVGERLERAMHVGLHDQVQRRDSRPAAPGRRCLRGGRRRRASSGCAARRPCAGASAPRRPCGRPCRSARRAARRPRAARRRDRAPRPVPTGRLRSPGWPCSSNIARTRPHAGPGDDRVADAQRAFLHERGHDRAATLVEVRLEHVGDRELLRVGDEVCGSHPRRRRAGSSRAARRHPGRSARRRRPRSCRRPTPRARARCSVSCWRTRVGSASSRSTFVTATTIGTSAARAWLIDSTVCGITPSSAATTRIAMSVTSARRANASR